MRVSRSYVPGKGVVDVGIVGDPVVARKPRMGARGRKGDIYFDRSRNRLEARGNDGHAIGIELYKGG